MKKGIHSEKIAVGKSGWLPFWFGSKFNKRLMMKRIRQKERRDRHD